MDGTLIKHSIDFNYMRTAIYEIADNDTYTQNKPSSKRRGDVLELCHTFSPLGQRQAKDVFKTIESNAIRDMTLMEDIGPLCQYIDDTLGIQRAVLTRNVLNGVDALHAKLWEETGLKKEFYPIVCRETLALDGKTLLPSKPFPDAIFHICDIWDCHPGDVVMVGDSDADDIVAASRAGCGGKVLLALGGECQDTDSGGGGPKDDVERMERLPSLVVNTLQELLEILKQS